MDDPLISPGGWYGVIDVACTANRKETAMVLSVAAAVLAHFALSLQ